MQRQALKQGGRHVIHETSAGTSHRSLSQTVTLYWEVESRPSVSSDKTRHTLPEVKYFHTITMYIVKSHSSTSTSSQSEKFQGNCQNACYYKPHKDQDTYFINSESHLQCHQDPQKTIKVSNPQELPGSSDHPIYIVPGSVTINSVDDLI